MKTIEGNKLIAEFMPEMSYPCQSLMDKGIDQWLDDEGEYYLPEELKYHLSWDWVIPVAKKCLNIAVKDDWDQWAGSLLDVLGYCDINALWNECTQFIQWYNKQKS